MGFENFENILTLFCTVIGLLFCLFKYIEMPKRGYLYLIVFFLSRFFSDYYWTVYTFVMHSVPEVSELAAYFGWNVGYVFLFFSIFHMQDKRARRVFHPVVFWPVLTNLLQFFLYIRFGGILNNLWAVGWTTPTMIFCMQDILYYWKNRNQESGDSLQSPCLSMLVLMFLCMEYAMWTASCFNWDSELSSPYLYAMVLGYLSLIFFAWGAGKVYRSGESIEVNKSEVELRFQTLLQTIVCLITFFGCAGGYYIAVRIKNTLPDAGAGGASGIIVTVLAGISLVLILMISLMLHEVTSRYRTAKKNLEEMDREKRGKFNLLFMIAVTLGLMIFSIAYNSRTLYYASVAEVYEDGKDVVTMTAVDLENYLTVAETTLRVTADTVDLMKQTGASTRDIYQYVLDETKRASEQFDENFTGIYAYVDGEYLDGLGWEPPAGYDPMSRGWYHAAVEGGGKVVIVPPYVDAQTGSVVITFARRISARKTDTGSSGYNVVCLDVIVNHIQEVTEQVSIAGKGYGMVVNADGFIIAHRDKSCNGKNISEIYGNELMNQITGAMKNRFDARFDATLNDEECSLFVRPIRGQWYAVIVVNHTELFENVYTQLVFNIMVSLIAFWLISYFYCLGYKNERNYGRKVEAMNIQVASALAAAIDAKDAYTNGHSSRVAKYARMIAARSGYSNSKQDEIYMMALLHDVGKIGVPDEVIKKPEKLTDEELAMIKRHPVIGNGILESIKERPNLAKGARWHHEFFAGGGYPDGLAGEAIPEEARIIAVADSYDAMTSRRSYRDVMPQDEVRAEIEKGSGTQFDPRFSATMLQMIDEDTDYSMREM